MRLEAWQLAYVAFPLLILAHLYVSPYTKVEESFNIQAAHDILKYGVPTTDVGAKFRSEYDHMTFPGAVPRTFIGSLILAAVAKPIIWIGALDGWGQQFVVRASLGLMNALALIIYTRGVRAAYGPGTALWYTILQCSQFHIIYYASRTLPNMFAFGICTLAQAFVLPNPTASLAPVKRTRLALYLLTFATIVFRSEVALLLGTTALYTLLRTSPENWPALFRTTFIPAILSAAVAGISLTVAIDTFFWQSDRWLWPELAAFLSNVFPTSGAGASEWGTSPWHWYFSSALPRLLLNPLLFLLVPWAFVATTLRGELGRLLLPTLGFAALYSLLPHKETRFIFPIVPPVTAATALCANHVSSRASRALFYRLTTLALVATTLVAALVSHALLAPLSALGYPGAHALPAVHAAAYAHAAQPAVHVHLTNLALQTGTTLFLQEPARRHRRAFLTLPGAADGSRPTLTSLKLVQWRFDRSDNATARLEPRFWAAFDYAVVEAPERAIGAWDVVERIPALGRPRLLAPHVGRGCLVLGPRGDRREDDGLARVAEAVYGATGKFVYGVVHDVLREGYGVGFSLTRGWWVHWGLEPKLYVLKKGASGISPNSL